MLNSLRLTLAAMLLAGTVATVTEQVGANPGDPAIAANGSKVSVIDRATCFFPLASSPLASGAATRTGDQSFPRSIRGPNEYDSLSETFSDQTLVAWSNYLKVWRLHHAEPGNEFVRRFLGLSLRDALPVRRLPPRSAPDWLRWQRGTYRQLESPHFQLLTKASEDDSRRILEDLERTYWVWTQMFFPFWKENVRVAKLLDGMQTQGEAAEFLERTKARLPAAKRLRVVLFGNAKQYQAALADSVPGIEMSSGFYGDGRRTMFLFVGGEDDPATRRHELTHQLFREATSSGLGRGMPGQTRDFWLIEGIAGYMESLRFDTDRATVGGWDSPRLQFARYRVFATNDFIASEELQHESMTQVQSRSDLPRWYAHSIMQTHWLMDHSIDGVDSRGWVFGKLAELYRIKTPDRAPNQAPQLTLASLKSFLAVDDARLRANPTHEGLVQLCLIGCSLSRDAIATIPTQHQLEWLDLSRLPVGVDDVRRLVGDPSSLRQLSLEATRMDASVGQWLRDAGSLRELDLSWSRVGDELVPAIVNMKDLQVLWLTGSQVGDGVAGAALSLRNLQSIDLQRTKVSAESIARMRRSRTSLQINPLKLQPAVQP